MNSVSNAEQIEKGELACGDFILQCHKEGLTYNDILRILNEAAKKVELKIMADKALS